MKLFNFKIIIYDIKFKSKNCKFKKNKLDLINIEKIKS